MSAYSDRVRSEPSLVAYWRLNEKTGTEITDSAGRYGLVGVVSGNPLGGPSLVTDDLEAGSARFIESAQKIEIPNATPLQITGDMTIEFMVAHNGTAAASPYICKRSAGYAAPYAVEVNSELKMLASWGNGESAHNETISSPIAMIAGRPYHIAITKWGIDVSMFVDGASIVKQNMPVTIKDGGGALNIGFEGEKSIGNCLISEIAIYRSALSSRTVMSHYELARN